MLEIKRILVALNANSECDIPIKPAIELANRFNVSLNALLVEDIDLLNLAELPFGAESISGRQVQKIDISSLERMTKYRVERISMTISRSAAERSVQWELERVRGKIVTVLENAAKATDLLVIGRGCEGALVSSKRQSDVVRLIDRSSCSILLAENKQPEFLIVWLRANGNGLKALDVALQFCGSNSMPLIIAFAGQFNQIVPEPIRQKLELCANKVFIYQLSDNGLESIKPVIGEYKGMLVVEYDEMQNDAEVDRLIDYCKTILFVK